MLRPSSRFIEGAGPDLSQCATLPTSTSGGRTPFPPRTRGHRVYEAPPNSSGHVLLQELSLAERFDLGDLGCNTPESIHVMVEAKRLAFADREAYMADPEWVEVPIPGLLSKEYAAERAKLIDPERSAASVAAGDPWPLSGLAAAEGHRRRLRAERGHHLLLRRRPVGQRRVHAPEPANGLRLQRHRGQHRRAAQQPDDLLAPGPQPHRRTGPRQARPPHHEPGHGL